MQSMERCMEGLSTDNRNTSKLKFTSPAQTPCDLPALSCSELELSSHQMNYCDEIPLKK